MSKNDRITIQLTNNQVLHVWSILASYMHDTVNELKHRGTFKKDGTPNHRQKFYSDLEQEKIDNITIAKLVCDYIEEQADFQKPEETRG